MLIDKQPNTFLEDVSSLIKVFGALATSPKWYQVRAVIRSSVGGTIESIVCLAIGRLHNTDINDEDEQQPNLQVTFQIALLLLLCNEFQIPVENRIIYDPRHTKEDNFLWKMLGLTPQNFNAKDPVTSNTLFYMPFCPWGVTEDIVASNWTQLERISILGNSFSFVIDPHTSGTFEEGVEQQQPTTTRAPHVKQAKSRCKEIICWEGDHETWLSGETSEGFPQHQLDSTIVSFPMLDDEDATKKWMRFKPYPQSKL